MKLTKILKSKRGMAIENAVLFILIIFSLCSLMALMALTQHYQTKIDKIRLDQDIELEQIGEHFLAYLESDAMASDTSFVTYLGNVNYEAKDKYDYEIYGYALAVKSKDGDSVLLYVRSKLDGGKVKLESLSYSEPQDKVIDQIGASFLEYLENSNIETDTNTETESESESEKFENYLSTKNINTTGYKLLVGVDANLTVFAEKEDGTETVVLQVFTQNDNTKLKLKTWWYPNIIKNPT